MLESELATYFANVVKEAGGMQTKINASERGWPDRLVCFPDGYIYFVELKQQKGRISESQKHVHKQLAAFVHPVTVLRTIEQVNQFIHMHKQYELLN